MLLLFKKQKKLLCLVSKIVHLIVEAHFINIHRNGGSKTKITVTLFRSLLTLDIIILVIKKICPINKLTVALVIPYYTEL